MHSFEFLGMKSFTFWCTNASTNQEQSCMKIFGSQMFANWENHLKKLDCHLWRPVWKGREGPCINKGFVLTLLIWISPNYFSINHQGSALFAVRTINFAIGTFVVMYIPSCTYFIGGSRGACPARPPRTGPDSFVLTCKFFET